jgi:exodeoxyribonuclease VII large subunit
VIILGRGGGSAEDLWEFNGEELARAVAECKTPVISAVGHQRDHTICDLCADLCAPTPSAAAELAVPDFEAERQYLEDLCFDLKRGINIHLELHNRNLMQKKSQIYAFSPQKVVKENRQNYAHLVKLLEMAMQRQMERRFGQLSLLRCAVNDNNPLEILAKGYSITSLKDGKPLTSAKTLVPGQELVTRLSDGVVYSTVTQSKDFAGE